MSKILKVAITELKLRRLLKKELQDKTMTDWGKKYKMTPQQVSAFIRKKQGAGARIPAALGYKPITVYIPIDADSPPSFNEVARQERDKSKKRVKK